MNNPYRDIRNDLRRIRAHQLVGHVVHIIDPFLCEHGERNGHRDAARALMEAFFDAGVEVLTDHMRVDMGLPKRDEKGWTPEEVRALEHRRLEALYAPTWPK